MATLSAQLLALRGRAGGTRQKLGLDDAQRCAQAQQRLSRAHPTSPSWAFSQNRGHQELGATPSDPSSSTCSIRLLLISPSPTPSQAADTLHGLGHVPALHLPTPGGKNGQKSHPPGQGRIGTTERKERDAQRCFLAEGQTLPPFPCSAFNPPAPPSCKEGPSPQKASGPVISHPREQAGCSTHPPKQPFGHQCVFLVHHVFLLWDHYPPATR